MKVEELSETFERRAVTVSFEETARFTEVYGFVGRSGRIFLEGQLLLPPGSVSETLLIFMHPSSSLSPAPGQGRALWRATSPRAGHRGRTNVQKQAIDAYRFRVSNRSRHS